MANELFILCMQIISSDDYGCLYGATSFLWNYTKILSHTGIHLKSAK